VNGAWDVFHANATGPVAAPYAKLVPLQNPFADWRVEHRLLERQITGANWSRTQLPKQHPQVPRFTFFGLKGGVGRSTALSILSRELAASDRKVLAIDLDLESPGLSSLMLAPDAVPDYGVVDWLVEAAVGREDDELLSGMVATSGLAAGTGGTIRVIPAGGTSGEYLEKLSRATLGLGVDDERGSFASLLGRMVDRLEERERPDVVLIDSRAGLHDLAAVAVNRLGGTTFLFSADTPQTWAGYRLLFDAWRSRPLVARDVRGSLQLVAAQVPETERTPYLARMTERAWDLFRETLYDEVGPEAGDEEDAFNFDLSAIDAPHRPLPIYWGREFQGYDPVGAHQRAPRADGRTPRRC
jgi:hypothetical protein